MTASRPRFHVTLHLLPDGTWQSGLWDATGEPWKTVLIGAESLQSSFPISFEDAAAALSAEPRMYFEPDGSFVWVSPVNTAAGWQLDGMLYDRAGKLLYVELKGSVSRAAFSRLSQAIAPDSEMVVRVVQQGVMLRCEEFLRVFVRD